MFINMCNIYNHNALMTTILVALVRTLETHTLGCMLLNLAIEKTF
jgi:hypothetical protein